MKIICSLQLDPTVVGLSSVDEVRSEASRRTAERPCGVLRQWVTKEHTCLSCPRCQKVVFEEGEAAELKAKMEEKMLYCQQCKYWLMGSMWHGLCRLTGYETSNIARCQKIASPRTQGTSRGQGKE